MRKYLLGTGLIGALMSGYGMLKDADQQRFTWRSGLAWVSWAITLLLTIGHINDIRIASRGGLVSHDSPVSGSEAKFDRTVPAEVARALHKERVQARKAEEKATKKAQKALKR